MIHIKAQLRRFFPLFLLLFTFSQVLSCAACTSTSEVRREDSPNNSEGISGSLGASDKIAPERGSAEGFRLYQLPGLVMAKALQDSKILQNLRAERSCQIPTLKRARQLWINGRTRDVIHILEGIVECDPKPPHRNRALFLLSMALEEEGLVGDALEILERIPSDHYLSDHVDMLRARQLRTLGKPGKAIEAYERVMLERRNPKYHAARVERAYALFEAKRYEAAAAAFSDVVETYPEQPLLEQIYLNRGLSLLQIGQKKSALKDFSEVIFRWPFKRAALLAEEHITSLNGEGIHISRPFSERFERARILRRNKHWSIAEEALTRLLAEIKTPAGTSSREHKVQYEHAFSFYSRSNYKLAIPRFEALAADIAKGKDEGLKRSSVYKYLIRCYAYSKQFDGGLDAVKRRDRSLSKKAKSKNLAKYYEDNGRYKEALEHWTSVRKKSEQSAWSHVFLLYKAGHFKEAQKRLQRLASTTSKGRRQATYLYWSARAHMRLKNMEAARQEFAEIIERYPLEYYAYQSANRLWEMDIAASSPSTAPPKDNPKGTYPTGSAGVYWSSSPTNNPSIGELNDAARSDLEATPQGLSAYGEDDTIMGSLEVAVIKHGTLFPRLLRASFLFDVGMVTAARREARNVALEYRALRKHLSKQTRRSKNSSPWKLVGTLDDHYIDHRKKRRGYWGIKTDLKRFPIPDSEKAREVLFQRQRAILNLGDELFEDLRMALKEVGDFHMIRRWSARSRLSKTDPMNRKLLRTWMEAHPRAFPRLVQKHAAANGTSPYLMWALMTVESAYNPDSISYADARGLLQVIPKTGIKVATSMKVDGYGPHDLLDERLSIRFGSWYFAQLVHKFHGQEPFAIAGYNGGPHNVARWLTMRGEGLELDEFIETIPFNQARNYVKKVLRYAGLYRRIYEKNPRLYVGNRINLEFEIDPNY